MKQGFSLVELSIVLVILGLLTGGILAGQSLIRAAELRSVSTDISRYMGATQAFRDKYFALPGDMTNATKFWGTDSSGCPNGGGATGTCDGNGDGVIGSPAPAQQCENQEYWRQLARAGLVEGSYTPNTTAVCANNLTGGKEIPKLRLSNGVISMIAIGNITASGSYPGNAFYPGSYGNAFTLGTFAINVNYLNIGYILKPEEAWNIDTKMDDGKPGYGTVTVPIPGLYNTSCATSATASAAAYSLNLSSTECPLIVKSGF